MSKAKQKINSENLKEIVGLNGFGTVTRFAESLDVKRQSVYRALDYPSRFKKLVGRINTALPVRQTPKQ